MAALVSSPETRELASGSIEVAEEVDTVRIREPAKGEIATLRPHRTASSVEDLSSSGQFGSFDIVAPHEGKLPLLGFAARQLPAAGPLQVSYSRFAKPVVRAAAPVVAARRPDVKPVPPRPARRAEDKAVGAATSPVMAYAPTTHPLEAPFDALMGGIRGGEGNAAAIYMPRPRPGDDIVEEWLDGRSKAVFAAGQHEWMQNPLPASVYTAKEQKCLTEAVYFEARGEPELGQAAVAQVVLNRVRNPAYPETICAVVYQNKHLRNRCQFSFACDGVPDRVRSKRAWRIAERVAEDVTDGATWLEDVADSTHYHANYVSPRWGRTMIKKDRVGAHIFYRTRYGGWS